MGFRSRRIATTACGARRASSKAKYTARHRHAAVRSIFPGHLLNQQSNINGNKTRRKFLRSRSASARLPIAQANPPPRAF